jgi:hypothetical protein
MERSFCGDGFFPRALWGTLNVGGFNPRENNRQDLHDFQDLKPLKKVSSIQTAGFCAISRFFCHKKHKKSTEISSPFVFFVAFVAEIIPWDYSGVSI